MDADTSRNFGVIGRLVDNTRARIVASLDWPLSTTALAAITGLSPTGASGHLLTLRDAGLLSTTRHGHEVRYHRMALGSALLNSHAGEPHLG